MLEKAEEAKFVRWLKKNKIKFKKKIAGELLDRWILLPNGTLLIIELKRKESGSLSRRQIAEIKSLKKLGYSVEVCHGAEAAIEEVEKRLVRRKSSRSGKLHRRSAKNKLPNN